MTSGELDPLHRDRRAMDYHLGRLSAEQAEAVEAEYFSDAHAFAVLDTCADELVDDYLGGRLDATSLAQFEALMEAPAWAERIRFGRALREVVRLESAESSPPVVARIAHLLTTPASQAAAWILAAAVLLLAVGTSVITRRELVGLRARLDVTAAARAEAERLVRVAEGTAAEERDARTSLARRLESLTTLAVMVTPGTRSGGASLVRVPAGTSLVRITAVQDAPLPSGIFAARFELRRGSTQTAGGTIPLTAILARDGIVEVSVPADALAVGEYELRIALATVPGQFVDFARYTFSVVP